ncbi:hypothetical protein CEXT_499271 [Caerostris extrusa]|uniref:Uncharacterized protein n=1 Tax=Caerostris extrusa TaxID=172846 RepID=A0AAV4NT92_CAEEX|nr:hypothetical protein CEXT_499271 [Caerostris extrusa]
MFLNEDKQGMVTGTTYLIRNEKERSCPWWVYMKNDVPCVIWPSSVNAGVCGLKGLANVAVCFLCVCWSLCFPEIKQRDQSNGKNGNVRKICSNFWVVLF